jgi:hypothetical protein
LAEIEKAIEAEMTAAKTPGAAVAVISGYKPTRNFKVEQISDAGTQP